MAIESGAIISGNVAFVIGGEVVKHGDGAVVIMHACTLGGSSVHPNESFPQGLVVEPVDANSVIGDVATFEHTNASLITFTQCKVSFPKVTC